MRKITTILLLISLFSISFVYANTFSDVSEEHWANTAINTMVEKEILDGYPDGTFMPEKLITKAEFAKILVETLNLENMYEEIDYADVPYEFWAYRYINIADQYFEPVPYEPGDMFYPNQTLTREEVATIIVRAMWLDELQYNDETLEKVLDNDEISDELKKYVAIAYEQNIMRGNADGTFNPKGNLTRAEVCQLMKNVIDIKEEEQVLYESLAGRWLPEKAYDKNFKEVSLNKLFDFEITDKNKLVLDKDAVFDNYLYSYYDEVLINRDYGTYQLAVNEVILKHNAYEIERLAIKEEKGIKYLVREIGIWNDKKQEKEEYFVYYKLQDKTEIITDVVESSTPKKDELIDNTAVNVEIKYYDEIRAGKLKITNSKNEIIKTNVELKYSTISALIQCEPNETYIVTAYDVFDMNGYKLEDYTYKFSISNELANFGPQYREYSSKKATTKYKLEDYPEYEEMLKYWKNQERVEFTGYKLYDIYGDKKPELLIGIDNKIRLILDTSDTKNYKSYHVEIYKEICENNIILDYYDVPQKDNQKTRIYIYRKIDDEGHAEDINCVVCQVNNGEITWQEDMERGIGTAKTITKEQFYSILDEYKIIKIELDNYTID